MGFIVSYLIHLTGCHQEKMSSRKNRAICKQKSRVEERVSRPHRGGSNTE